MAIASGTNGSVTNSSGYSVGITGWSIDTSIAELDITSWGDAASGVIWREFIAGIREFTGSITAKWDPTASVLAGIGTELSVTLTADTEQGSGGVGFTASIIVTGISPAVEIEGITTVGFAFRGAGALVPVLS